MKLQQLTDAIIEQNRNKFDTFEYELLKEKRFKRPPQLLNFLKTKDLVLSGKAIEEIYSLYLSERIFKGIFPSRQDIYDEIAEIIGEPTDTDALKKAVYKMERNFQFDYKNHSSNLELDRIRRLETVLNLNPSSELIKQINNQYWLASYNTNILINTIRHIGIQPDKNVIRQAYINELKNQMTYFSMDELEADFSPYIKIQCPALAKEEFEKIRTYCGEAEEIFVLEALKSLGNNPNTRSIDVTREELEDLLQIRLSENVDRLLFSYHLQYQDTQKIETMISDTLLPTPSDYKTYARSGNLESMIRIIKKSRVQPQKDTIEEAFKTYLTKRIYDPSISFQDAYQAKETIEELSKISGFSPDNDFIDKMIKKDMLLRYRKGKIGTPDAKLIEYIIGIDTSITINKITDYLEIY